MMSKKLSRSSQQVTNVLTKLSTPKSIGRRCLMTAGSFKVPPAFNEPNLHYAKGSPERQALSETLSRMKSELPITIPTLRNGQPVNDAKGNEMTQLMPAEHSSIVAKYTAVTEQDVSNAIESALQAKQEWQDMPFYDRAGIFLRAADLVSTKYRYELMAATMLGQGKNAWQAEIDAAAELADFYRFNVSFAQEIFDRQPQLMQQGHGGRTDWRPLEGFVYAISPFNFTAIGGNLISGPALMGNVVLWKPSPGNALASYIVYKILLEAGLPPNVIQFINGDAEMITKVIMDHSAFSGFAFTGSSKVFRSLWHRAAQGVMENKYKDFPRMVAETSGKNFHLVHNTADISSTVKHTVRASFEYSGQKCSACSRIYIPKSKADEFLGQLKDELSAIKMGAVEEYSNFLGPVINKEAFDRITKVIAESNKDSRLEKIAGGNYDGSKGYYIEPTVYVSNTLEHELFDRELFGPVLVVYVYDDAEYDQILTVVDRQGGGFALTGAVFANDPVAIRKAENKLRYAAGNFYINAKTTAAVIGQQSFGGGRSSGTNDKAGSADTLRRFTTPRTLKEEYYRLGDVLYPSNL